LAEEGTATIEVDYMDIDTLAVSLSRVHIVISFVVLTLGLATVAQKILIDAAA
jgi:hypothetical protein